MTGFEWFQVVAAGATAIGVGVATAQLWLTRQLARTTFEDQLAAQYRAIAEQIPMAALLGQEVGVDGDQLRPFFHYIDLCNEQVFLRMRGRIRKDTWLDWSDGIRSNLSRPAFRAAWDQIKARSDGAFRELRLLEAAEFRVDPRKWRRGLPRLPGTEIE